MDGSTIPAGSISHQLGGLGFRCVTDILDAAYVVSRVAALILGMGARADVPPLMAVLGRLGAATANDQLTQAAPDQQSQRRLARDVQQRDSGLAQSQSSRCRSQTDRRCGKGRRTSVRLHSFQDTLHESLFSQFRRQCRSSFGRQCHGSGRSVQHVWRYAR